MKSYAILLWSLLLPLLLNAQITNVQIISDPLLDAETYGIVEGDNETFYAYNFKNEVFEISFDSVRQLNFDCRFCEVEDFWYEGGDSLLLMTSREGLFRYTGDTAIPLFDSGAYHEVARAVDGKIYIGSESTLTADNSGFGISIDGGTSFSFISAASSALPSDIIYDIEVEGNNVWLATAKGLVLYNGFSFVVYTNNELSDTYYDVDVAPDNSVWVSSAFGGLGKVENGQLKHFPQAFNSFSTVNQVTVDGFGGAWTEDDALVRVTATDIYSFPLSVTGLSGAGTIARELFVDSQNRLWVSSSFSNDLAVLTLDFPTTTRDLSPAGIRVYPNPATGELYIDLSEHSAPFGAYRMELSDTGGRVLRRQVLEATPTRISLTDLSPGIYVVTVYDGLRSLGSKRVLVE